MLKQEAIKMAVEMGNAVAVEYQSSVIKGYHVVSTDDMKVGKTIMMGGVIWKITKIQYTQDTPLIDLEMVRKVGGWKLF